MRRPFVGLAALGAVAAGTAAANAYIGRQGEKPDNGVGGVGRNYRWRHGNIFYAVAGEGDPLLFIHGIGAGASDFEWRKNFRNLSADYRVYAPDLLGFGLSDKPDIRYTPDIYIQLIADFILDVVGRPTAVAGSSHGAAYAVEAADKHSLIINRLILSCPTGVELSDEPRPMSPGLNISLKVPVIGTSVYYGLTSRLGIEDYLATRVYADPASVTERVISHYYDVSHQPGADRAVRAFAAGDLNVSVRRSFASLRQPSAVVWGREAKIGSADIAGEFGELNPRSRVYIVPDSAQLPHEERPDEWNLIARDMLERDLEDLEVPTHERFIEDD